MLVLVSIVTLLVFVFVRPHEMIPALASVPLLNLLFAFTLVALVIDSRVKIRVTAQIGAAFAFLSWSLASLAIAGREDLIEGAIELTTPVVLFVSIAWGAGNFRRLALASTVVVSCSALLAVVGAHQSRAERGCVEYTAQGGADRSVQTFDGRSCESRMTCYEDTDKIDVEYTCEHIGLLGTNSFSGRVRYRGILNDPNEFALALAAALPLLLAVARIRSRLRWKLAVPIVIAAAVISVLASGSRGGLLALLVTVAVFLVYRYRGWGLLVTGFAGLAGLLVGGRGSAAAASSVYERYDAWSVALGLLRHQPIFGVGHDGFLDHHYLTAHNSYLLIAAESGLVGLVLFSVVLYASIKIPLVILLRLEPGPETTVARTWALALFASLAALMTGMLFLSLSYHQVIWVYLGLAGALYASLRASDPSFSIRFGVPDLLAVLVLDVTVLAAFKAFLMVKGL